MIILAFAENSIQLVPDGTMLIHILIVVGMVFILNRTMFRPINKVLADREARTSGRLTEAQKLQADIEQNMKRYESGLREARSAAYHMVEGERAAALKSREQKVNQVREEIRALTNREKNEIERQAQAARETLRAEAVQTAAEIGSQILRRRVG
ncbi:MAG TPA: ATP synthase F0 subunit B [Pyrinomonadaceae bacterium]|nr:ATP synthase F0 subunit B [Pyrinomonadaceae bacterium]